MRRGFALLETIVVISVLCIVLTALFAGYSNMIRTVKAESKYDNTEYLYKTYIIGSFMEKYIVDEASYICSNCNTPYIFCSEKTTSCNNLSENTEEEEYLKFLVERMRVLAIYITKWDTSSFSNRPEIMNAFEATTQRYIKALNPDKRDDAYRIIVMFTDENDESSIQYASVEFSSNVRSIGYLGGDIIE